MKQILIVHVNPTWGLSDMHVILSDSDSEMQDMVYHIPLGGEFCMSMGKHRDWDPCTTQMLVIDLDDTEFDLCCSYIHDLCGKPFNMADFFTPSIVDETFLTEVPDESATGVQKVFPAQAVLLILRSCLREDRRLYKALRPINSRAISTSHLFTVLQPYGKARSVDFVKRFGMHGKPRTSPAPSRHR